MDIPRGSLDRLNMITSRYSNDYNRTLALSLNNQIADLRSQIKTKQIVLENLKEQEEAYRLKLDTKQDLQKNYSSTLEEQIGSLRTKSNILTTYYGVLNTHEFLINRYHSEVNEFNKDLIAKWTQITDKTRFLLEDYNRMKGLIQSCNELKEKTCRLMAPSH